MTYKVTSHPWLKTKHLIKCAIERIIWTYLKKGKVMIEEWSAVLSRRIGVVVLLAAARKSSARWSIA